MPSFRFGKEESGEKQKLLKNNDDPRVRFDTKAGHYGSGRKDFKRSSVPIKDLFRYSTPLDYGLLFVGGLVAIGTGVGWPFTATIFGDLSNTFINAQSSLTNESGANGLQPVSMDEFFAQTVNACIRYAILGTVLLVTGYVQMACWITACERQIYQIRTRFLHAILGQDIQWFDENQSGTLTSKLSDNLERIKEGIGDKFGLLIQYVSQFLAGFVIAFIYNWKLTLVMLVVAPLLALSAAFITRLITTAVRKEQEQYAVAGAIAEEVLSCIRTVITFNGQKRESSRYERALTAGKRHGVLKGLYTGVGMGFVFFIVFAAYALAFWIGALLINSGEIEPGTVFVVLYSVMLGSFALGNAGPTISTLAAAKGAAAAIFDIIDREPDINPYSHDGLQIDNPKGKIEFANVYFRYPSRLEVKVLDNISLSVEPGETVALVGASGCGKSTIVNLLLRFYDPESGNVLLDGEPLENLNVHWLRNTIAVVAQEPILFDVSIEENIRFGRQNITRDEMVLACRLANAHEFITDLPDGYATAVGERGAQLSGGQKQRLAIARALVRDPRVLLLDEATSALDADSEQLVQTALEKAQQGRTTIVIAHRLSTIRGADKIIAMEAGSVKEVGTHAELMNLKGVYYNLVTAQLFGDATSGYATADELQKDDSEDSGTSVERPKTHRQKSAQRQSSRTSVGSDASSDASSAGLRKRRKSILERRVDGEKERLRKDLEEASARRSGFVEMAATALPDWHFVLLGLVFASLRGLVFPLWSVLFSEMYNTFSLTGDAMVAEAIRWAILMVAMGVLQAVTVVASNFFFGLSSENITMRMRMAVFSNVLRQDAAYFDDPRHSTGKICTRLATDAPNVRAAVDYRLSQVFTAAVSMVAGVILALIYGWKMAIIVLITFPLGALGTALRFKLKEGSAKRDAELLEEAGKTAAEAIENIKTVQALTRETTFYEHFREHLHYPYKESVRQAHIQAISYGFSQAIMFWTYAVSFLFGGYLVSIHDMDPVSVFRVFFAINFSSIAVSWATAFFPEFLKARYSAGLVFQMMRVEPRIDNTSVAGLRPEINGVVTFNDVYFSYPMRSQIPVLRGFEIKVSPGETVALVGPSGCGKSTVVALLERLYDPTDGAVKIDYYDMRTLNTPYVRSHISLVSQEPILFDCSIQENIIYGLEDENIPPSRIIDAARLANIHDFVDALPEGYNTRVGEKGTQLSGGQKQRVAIARALIRNPKILLLDEATSALDTDSEKVVQDALDRARAGRTCVIIAHRLSTVQSADRIAVIRNGIIVEQGSHAELITARGVYYNLTKKQNLQA